jgi:hypothetical protein
MKLNLTTKQKILSGIAVSALLGVAIWATIHRINAKKIYKQLNDDLAAHKGETGTADDLTQSGGALNPNYVDQSKSTNLLSDSAIQTGITNLNKWIGHTWLPDSDEDSILAYLKSLANKAQVSQLAKAYQQKYGNDLLTDLYSVDGAIKGWTWVFTTAYVPLFKAAIDALPDK